MSGLSEVQLPEKLRPLFEPARYKVLYGGRGAAKSWGVARALLIIAAQRPLRVLCAREIQKTIADSVHRLLSDQIASMGLGAFYEVKEAEIIGANGSAFIFAGIRGQDIGKIKSFEGVDICWVEEAQVVTKKSWDVLIPTIRKPGSEIWVTFNPELSTDETYVRFVQRPPEDTCVIQMGWRDNPWFPDVLEKERQYLERADPESYRNVWEGECRASVEGAIYAREIAEAIEGGRVRAVPADPLLKTHTVWDLGFNDCTAIIMVQKSASELRIVNYIEDTHRTIASYVSELHGLGYNWGTDYVPWDGAEERYRLTDGRTSPEGILKTLGRKAEAVPKVDVETGIGKARLVFPRVYFDAERAERLVECLKRYRRSVNQTTGEPGAPLHDEHSHGSDAFRYLAIVAEQMTNDERFITDPYAGFRRHAYHAN